MGLKYDLSWRVLKLKGLIHKERNRIRLLPPTPLGLLLVGPCISISDQRFSISASRSRLQPPAPTLLSLPYLFRQVTSFAKRCYSYQTVKPQVLISEAERFGVRLLAC